MDTLGERMKSAREAAGVSQTQLADAIGTRPNVIWRYENNENEPRSKRLREIARIIRCDPDWLLTGEEPVDSAPEIQDYPGLTEFLQTKAGKTVTPDELALLRTLRAATGRPTSDTYRMMLMIWRETSEE